MFLELIDNVAKIAQENAVVSPDDYTNDDGLLVCGKCNVPKQMRITLPEVPKYTDRVVHVQCKCAKQQELIEQQELRKNKLDTFIKEWRKKGISDSNYLKYRFENDDSSHTKISCACRRYAGDFPEMKRRNQGILFCGSIGIGKTFYAGCIANHVLEMGITVLMTNLSSLMNRMMMNSEEKNYVLDQVRTVSLLVIDDLGIERDTSFTAEKIYEILTARYHSGKPLIVTTNLTPKSMKECTNDNYKRIYDRVLEMCHPIVLVGESRRIKIAEEKNKFMKEFLGV